MASSIYRISSKLNYLNIIQLLQIHRLTNLRPSNLFFFVQCSAVGYLTECYSSVQIYLWPLEFMSIKCLVYDIINSNKFWKLFWHQQLVKKKKCRCNKRYFEVTHIPTNHTPPTHPPQVFASLKFLIAPYYLNKETIKSPSYPNFFMC